jgi:hypothetical protein
LCHATDAYPTSIKIAVLLEHVHLQAEMERLVAALRAKSEEFRDVLKMGRTQLQDAVPMTLGQEFNSWASTIAADLGILQQVAQRFYTVNMGGTALGTGIAATRGYSVACVRPPPPRPSPPRLAMPDPPNPGCPDRGVSGSLEHDRLATGFLYEAVPGSGSGARFDQLKLRSIARRSATSAR